MEGNLTACGRGLELALATAITSSSSSRLARFCGAILALSSRGTGAGLGISNRR